jgi:DNA (cytosine-5)-methyltransferase 1
MIDRAPQLVLSLFPGIDLLGRGFEEEGFFVVRGPDLIWGQSIETFHAPPGRFDGIIAGSPCQNWSMINRNRDRAAGDSSIAEFSRLVTEANVDWWLLENVPTVPTVTIRGYRTQRLDLRASECGLKQNRLRHFQFGSKEGRVRVLIPERVSLEKEARGRITLERCCLATEGRRPLRERRSFPDFCELQGLPRDFDLPGWSLQFKYKAVGNAVPFPMARVIARAVVNARAVTSGAESPKLCICDCGRPVTGRRKSALPACRKRLQRRRPSPGVVSQTVLVTLGD